jgi:site-specific recombinase XerD
MPEPSLLPVVRLPQLVSTRNALPSPAEVYLSALGPGSRRAMRASLAVIAEAAAPGRPVEFFPWHELRYEHTQALRARLAERYAPATANKALCALRGVLKECWRLGRMSAEHYHRAADVKGVLGQRLPAGRMLASGEVRALFESCGAESGPRARLDAALLGLLVGVGLRRAEVVALEVADYDASAGELRVRGKRNKERLVPVVNGAADALTDWIAVRGNAPGPLFCPVHRSGRISLRSMTSQAVYARLLRRAAVAGVRKFSPHDLRRTNISTLLDAGADISSVQRLAGHANVATTMRYDRRGEQAKRKAAQLVHVPYRGPSTAVARGSPGAAPAE